MLARSKVCPVSMRKTGSTMMSIPIGQQNASGGSCRSAIIGATTKEGTHEWTVGGVDDGGAAYAELGTP